MLLEHVLWLVNNIAGKSSLKGYASPLGGEKPRCGNVLRAHSTTSRGETPQNTQGNDLGQSKNEWDWIIRRVTT